ncbi:MAG: hypothetical protein CL927_20660 [Deltaproteobacteria bacterium]|nr:hypothetical protein [Deltaproteobacteria bacterium]HCH62811.1 hypothetical protein [Deltaproteobacteria bacterium]
MAPPFETTRTIRLGHTDAARRMFFARQFDLIHEAYEDWLEANGLPIRTLLEDSDFGLPIVRAESDYRGSLFAGDRVCITITVEGRTERSFTLSYVLRSGDRQVGTAKTVHVAVDRASGRSCPISGTLADILSRQLD